MDYQSSVSVIKGERKAILQKLAARVIHPVRYVIGEVGKSDSDFI